MAQFGAGPELASDNRWIEIDGVRKTLSEWIAAAKLPYSTVRKRINRGVLPKRALGLT